MSHYWNHNTAYHPWLLRAAAARQGDVLDVGCGEGLLLARLAAVSRTVTGIDVDVPSIARAARRTKNLANISVLQGEFADYCPGEQRFDLITFVATIHHMELRASLRKARSLLTPGGALLVVGLAANKTIVDWTISGLALPLVRLGSFMYRETRDIGVPVADARETLSAVRHIARQELPGVSVRRGLYYRYLLSWTNGTAQSNRRRYCQISAHGHSRRCDSGE